MKQILIIDDDMEIGNMMEEALIKESYEVLRAYSGTEALYVLSARKPDLILLDLMLPGLSGEELLSQIKGIPVIVVSAKIDVVDKVSLLRKKLRNLSGRDYIEAVWGIGFKLTQEAISTKSQPFS